MDIFQLPGILLKRWLWVVVPASFFILLGVAYVIVVKPTVPVTADILIDPQGLVAEKSELVPSVSASNQDQAVLESQIYVMQSGEILNDVVDKLELTKDPFLFNGPTDNVELARAATVIAVQKHLSIERAGQSFILNLTFKHRDPVRGAAITNAIASIYLKKVHEARSDASNRASSAFELQAQALATRVRKAESELESFKAVHSLVSTGQQGLVIDQQVEGVNKQLIAARADLGAKRASFEQARSLTVGSVQDGAIPEALASTALGSMRARYADLAATMSELSSSLGANHPQMRAVRSQVDGMRQAIEQELARIRQSLQSGMERSQANVEALETRLSELTRSSLDTSEAGIKARQLQSEVDTLRVLYKAFLSRSEELGQRDTVNINSSRIISKAVAIGSSSKLAQVMILIAAALFGTAAGCGIAVLRELLGRFFQRPEQGEQNEQNRESHPQTSEVLSMDHDSELPQQAPSADKPAPDRTRIEPDKEGLPAEEHPPEEAAVARDDGPSPAAVIAHMPALRQAAALLRFGNARRHSEISLPGLTGLQLTVDRILEFARPDGAVTIVLLSPGKEAPGRELARDIADALYRREKDVLFSLGEGLGESLVPPQADAPLGDILRYRRLAHVGMQSSGTAGPTFRNFANRHRKADFIIVDGRGQIASRHRDELLSHADGILLLASEGDGTDRLDDYLGTLAPWKDRLLGTVLFDQAA